MVGSISWRGAEPLRLSGPRLCVQVKSQSSPADVTVYRTLQGSMQSFDAEQGLLVCWGGFNRVVQSEARQSHFFVRLLGKPRACRSHLSQLREASTRMQADLPLKRVWTLVREEEEE